MPPVISTTPAKAASLARSEIFPLACPNPYLQVDTDRTITECAPGSELLLIFNLRCCSSDNFRLTLRAVCLITLKVAPSSHPTLQTG